MQEPTQETTTTTPPQTATTPDVPVETSTVDAAAVQPDVPAEPEPAAPPVDERTHTPAPRPTVPPEPEPTPVVDVAAQRQVEHAIAPGSAGPAVRELAQLLETIGKETYISRGDNHDNVFTDELMRQVRDVLVDYHRARSDDYELPQILRDLAMLNAVHADVWLILRQIAGEKESARA